MPCPCCGHEMEAKLPVVDVTRNTIAWGDKVVHAASSQIEVMAALCEAYPRMASKDFLIARVWGLGETDTDTEGALCVHIVKLRKHLQPLGFSVDVVYRQGWKIVRLEEVRHGSIGRSNGGAPTHKARTNA